MLFKITNHAILFLFFLTTSTFAQSFIDNTYKDIDEELVAFIENRYESSPFEGVKIIESDAEAFLISLAVVNRSEHKNQSTMDRIAVLKARRNALTYLQGSTITSEQIVKTGQTITGNSVSYYEEYFDTIRETSSGFVDGMSTLTTFTTSNGKNYVHAIYAILE
jgi:hypothetical protein